MPSLTNTPRLPASEAIETISIRFLSPALFKTEFQTSNKPVILNDVLNEDTLHWARSNADMQLPSASIDVCLNKISVHTGLRRKRTIDWQLLTTSLGHQEHLKLSVQDETIIQFRGKSRILLFPPTVTHNLYSIKKWHDVPTAHISQAEIESTHVEKFQKFKAALLEAQILHLEAGQTLYIPVGWWTQVQAAAPSRAYAIHCTWKVGSLWHYCVCPQAAYLCSLLGFLRLIR
jgi:hypothetical protein